MTNKLGIYIHVPFCESKCPYCDFYSKVGKADEMDRYVEVITRYLIDYSEKKPIDTIYFGGGTPSLLGAKRLLTILECIKSNYQVDEDAEITLEANPASAILKELELLNKGGFNRISFGVQSTNPGILKQLGRIHSREEAFDAIREAASAGFSNISADLMVGLANQTFEDIKTSISELAALPISHLSVYLLKIEEGTPFFTRYKELDDDFQSECYELVVSECNKLGFNQYEISNFAKNGKESRHNLRYWRLEDYIGIGPSAHSMVGGKRFYFKPCLTSFIDGNWNDIVPDGEAGGLAEDIMLSLRLTEGINLDRFADEYGVEVVSRLVETGNQLQKVGLINHSNNKLRLTVKGFLLSNSIISRLIDSLDL